MGMTLKLQGPLLPPPSLQWGSCLTSDTSGTDPPRMDTNSSDILASLTRCVLNSVPCHNMIIRHRNYYIALSPSKRKQMKV